MRHACSCGWELSPADTAEPLDAISHGVCAYCAAKYLHSKHPFWYTMAIDGYLVQFFIQPGRGSPHVAMDSPRYWDPPRPMRVIGTRLYLDGVELDPAEYNNLFAEAWKRANIPASPGGRSSLRPAFSRQMNLRLNGLLRTAMERTELGGQQ